MNNVTMIKDNMKTISLVMSPLKAKIRSNKKFIDTLLHILDGVPDFRMQGKIKYDLDKILCICLLIAMRGKFTSFYHAAMFIKVKADYFRRLGLIEGNNIPSHDTLRRIFFKLDANALRDCLTTRIKAFIKKITDRASSSEEKKVRLLSGDGKTFNGSGRKKSDRNVNVFNILDPSSELCLTSIPLDDKESEITTFQHALKLFSLKNTMVTADALHCQRETMIIIHDNGGEFTVAVKDNQPSLKEVVIKTFDNLKEAIDKYKVVYNDCDYYIFPIDYELTDVEFPGTKAFIKMISHKRKDQADYNPEPQYFISSSDNPQLIVETIDNRWHIEDGFHWWKDDFLKEDKCTFMDKNAIKVMATFNNITYALYRIASAIFDDSCMAETRIRYEECPEKMLEKLIPLLEKQNLTMLLKENMKGRKKS